jgi:hypothetical protein
MQLSAWCHFIRKRSSAVYSRDKRFLVSGRVAGGDVASLAQGTAGASSGGPLDVDQEEFALPRADVTALEGLIFVFGGVHCGSHRRRLWPF